MTDTKQLHSIVMEYINCFSPKPVLESGVDFTKLDQSIAQLFEDGKKAERERIIKKLGEIMSDEQIKSIEQNLKVAFNKNECGICGYNPRHQKRYLLATLTKE